MVIHLFLRCQLTFTTDSYRQWRDMVHGHYTVSITIITLFTIKSRRVEKVIVQPAIDTNWVEISRGVDTAFRCAIATKSPAELHVYFGASYT